MNSVRYYFPLTKRARLLLKLDSSFHELTFLMKAADCFSARQAIECIFEILQLIERIEIKMDLIREAEKFLQKDQLNHSPLAASIQILSQHIGKMGEDLRTLPSLMSLQKRIFQTSGACVFDVPSLHAWLSTNKAQRVMDLKKIYEPIAPLHEAITQLMIAYNNTFIFKQESSDNGLFHIQPLAQSTIFCIEINNSDPLLIPEVSISPKALFLKIWSQTSLLTKNIPYNGPITLNLSEY